MKLTATDAVRDFSKKASGKLLWYVVVLVWQVLTLPFDLDASFDRSAVNNAPATRGKDADNTRNGKDTPHIINFGILIDRSHFIDVKSLANQLNYSGTKTAQIYNRTQLLGELLRGSNNNNISMAGLATDGVAADGAAADAASGFESAGHQSPSDSPREAKPSDIRFPIREIPASPDEYTTWRYGVKATSYSILESDKADQYWDDIDRYHDRHRPREADEAAAPTFDDLHTALPEGSAVRKMNTKLFGNAIAAMKGSHGGRLLALIQVKITNMGAGRQLIAVLDEFYGSENAIRAKSARSGR